MLGRRKLGETNAAEHASTDGKGRANASVAANRYGKRVARNRDAREPVIRSIAQRSVRAARKRSVARIKSAPAAVDHGEKPGAVDCKIERTAASGQLALGEEHARTERNGSQPLPAGRDQLGEALCRSLESDDAGVGEVIGNRIEVTLLGRHAAGGGKERAIHAGTLLISRGP